MLIDIIANICLHNNLLHSIHFIRFCYYKHSINCMTEDWVKSNHTNASRGVDCERQVLIAGQLCDQF